jgi:hypothetical protein
MKFGRSLWLSLLVFVLLLALVMVLSTLIHELGHGLTAEALGGEFISIDVYPGFQIWPDFGKPFEGGWDHQIALMYYRYGPSWQDGNWRDGLVQLMGSGINLLLATFALVLLRVFRPKGLFKLLLAAEALMVFDIVFYTFLPLIGLRHLFFIGGANPEPLGGALKMGIPQPVFLLFVGVICLFYTGALLRLIIPKHIA